jgi:hypothetical protein
VTNAHMGPQGKGMWSTALEHPREG